MKVIINKLINLSYGYSGFAFLISLISILINLREFRVILIMAGISMTPAIVICWCISVIKDFSDERTNCARATALLLFSLTLIILAHNLGESN